VAVSGGAAGASIPVAPFLLLQRIQQVLAQQIGSARQLQSSGDVTGAFCLGLPDEDPNALRGVALDRSQIGTLRDTSKGGTGSL
jgi:hypothetical protein